ncbi:MAG: GlsB/YeaQ/YmgE family stress response membrane protein [Methylocystis sp.]
MHLPALHLPYQSLAVILLTGLLVGWIGAKFVTKYGMGIVGDVIVGVIGAYIGNSLAPRLGVHFGTGLVRTSLNATGGAIVLLLLVCLIRRV